MRSRFAQDDKGFKVTRESELNAARSLAEDTMNIDFPFHFDQRGRTATTGDDDHIPAMIQELLFTNPGDRVNPPPFRHRLFHMPLSSNHPALAPPPPLPPPAPF